jgi:hypothetical protein
LAVVSFTTSKAVESEGLGGGGVESSASKAVESEGLGGGGVESSASKFTFADDTSAGADEVIFTGEKNPPLKIKPASTRPAATIKMLLLFMCQSSLKIAMFASFLIENRKPLIIKHKNGLFLLAVHGATAPNLLIFGSQLLS